MAISLYSGYGAMIILQNRPTYIRLHLNNVSLKLLEETPKSDILGGVPDWNYYSRRVSIEGVQFPSSSTQNSVTSNILFNLMEKVSVGNELGKDEDLSLALAILKGDHQAALIAADYVLENYHRSVSNGETSKSKVE